MDDDLLTRDHPTPVAGEPLPATPESWAMRTLRARTGNFQVPESAALIVVLAALLIFFSIKSPVFFTNDNLINVLVEVATVGILACPATMLLVAGQFDLSVGSGIALTSTTFAYLVTHGWASSTAVLATIGLGLGAGVFNGFCVTVIGINALITTLGTLAAFSGFAYIITSGLPIAFNGFGTLALERPAFNIPWSVFVFFAFIVASVFILRMTVYGRSLFAIGANPVAARLAGIRVNRTIFMTFVLSGFAIADRRPRVCVADGRRLRGRGHRVRAHRRHGRDPRGGEPGRRPRLDFRHGARVLLILGIINNGLTLLNVESFWQDVVRGFLLISAVGFDVLRRRLTEG